MQGTIRDQQLLFTSPFLTVVRRVEGDGSAFPISGIVVPGDVLLKINNVDDVSNADFASVMHGGNNNTIM
jgi:hypothetical protein